ncbi:flagellar biosynthetic protein FliO [Actinokineospora auranticolor]|uniref:Flagellar protein n=1 Tax=Actinokineospora auranticolor TaxID=155976 RepID=A0A2S6GMM6_9PSEU|nr:flagellar biosynthetic protein FliO [Actinokineospora auranticolor]PPK66492.1 flagellar protein FliO/FliZ [Actinokineospora auranticolor]
MEALLRVFFALILVFIALWVVARLARRPLRGRRAGGLDVLARTQLSRGASVTVVKVDETALVLGVTDAGVSLLHTVDAEVFDHSPAPVHRTATTTGPDAAPKAGTGSSVAEGGALTGSALSPRTWKQAIESLRERSVRR